MRNVPAHGLRLPVAVAAVVASLGAAPAAAQDLSGRWVYEEAGQSVELQVRHDRASGRASGTLSMFGRTAPFTGVVAAGSLTVQQLGDVRASAENGTMTGQLRGGVLTFTIAQPGQPPVSMPMTRRGDAAALPPASATPAPAAGGAGLGAASDFTGDWQLTSSDGTSQELLRLAVSGRDVTGELTAMEHGYFSNRTTVKGRFGLRGTLGNGVLQLHVWNAEGSPNDSRRATARRRGEYLIVEMGDSETGYARPGRSLEQPAGASTDAAALTRAIQGRVYSTTSQAGGRDGAIAGGRMRLALCSNGRVEYDASDLASAGGGSVGGTVTRRGTWSVVLYAGTPAVRAQWEGTGTSYSLTAYFRVRPDAAGRSANVDGVDLPASGRC